MGVTRSHLKKEKQLADEIEIIPWEHRITPGHQLRSGWLLYKMGEKSQPPFCTILVILLQVKH